VSTGLLGDRMNRMLAVPCWPSTTVQDKSLGIREWDGRLVGRRGGESYILSLYKAI